MRVSTVGLMAVVAAVLAGCATIPPGPSVMVMPPPGKPFEAFQADDALCRGRAEQQSGWQANDTVNRNTADGAAIGAAIGSSRGLAVGWEVQRRYDAAYQQ